MGGNGAAPSFQMPLIMLGDCTVTVQRRPDNPQEKMITIGPLILGIPLDSEAAKVIVKGLTGVHVATSLKDVK